MGLASSLNTVPWFVEMENEVEVVLISSDLDSQSDVSEGDSDESETRAPEVINLTWSDTSVSSDDFESKKLTCTDSSDDDFKSKKPR